MAPAPSPSTTNKQTKRKITGAVAPKRVQTKKSKATGSILAASGNYYKCYRAGKLVTIDRQTNLPIGECDLPKQSNPEATTAVAEEQAEELREDGDTDASLLYDSTDIQTSNPIGDVDDSRILDETQGDQPMQETPPARDVDHDPDSLGLNTQPDQQPYWPSNQESMASNDSQTPSAPTYQSTEDPEMNGGNTFPVRRQEQHTRSLEEMLDDKLARLVDRFTPVFEQVGRHTKQIEELGSAIRRLEDGIRPEKLIKTVQDIVNMEKGGHPRPRPVANDRPIPSVSHPPQSAINHHDGRYLAGARGPEQETARIKKYCLARRTVRVWPILGRTEQEMMNNLNDFLMAGVGMAEEDVVNLGIDGVERAKSAPRAQAYSEIKVILSDADSRDHLASQGKHLSQYVDADGKPTAGFRMEVPDYLGGDFKTLNDYGFAMRRMHGQSTRWYIKYDDPKYGLVLELRIRESECWLKIKPQLARKFLAEGEQEEIECMRPKLTAKPRAVNDDPRANHAQSTSRLGQHLIPTRHTMAASSVQRVIPPPMRPKRPITLLDDYEQPPQRSSEAREDERQRTLDRLFDNVNRDRQERRDNTGDGKSYRARTWKPPARRN